MLHPGHNLKLLARVEGASIRGAKIAADPPSDRQSGAVVVSAVRADKADGRCPSLSGEPAVIALINRRVGAEIGDLVVAIVPNSLETFDVVPHRWVLHVGDEPTTGQLRIASLEVYLLERSHLASDIKVKAVGVIALVGGAIDMAKLLNVQPAEAITQRLAGSAVKAETVAGLLLPGINRLAQASDNLFGQLLLGGTVEGVRLIAEQHSDRLVQAYVTKRHRGATMLEDLDNGVFRLQTNATCPLAVEDRGNARGHFLESRNAQVQRLSGQLQAGIEKAVEVDTGAGRCLRYQDDRAGVLQRLPVPRVRGEYPSHCQWPNPVCHFRSWPRYELGIKADSALHSAGAN